MNNIQSENNKVASFSERLLAWYFIHAREMPWRVSPRDHKQGIRANPYHVWLSEIMLQQTQVMTVKDYFLKFIHKWPDVKDLAKSDLEDVMKAWAGLGYYSRARNLKKCADEIVMHHDGKLPKTYDELIKLPGIGDYTASAIASIAFDKPVAVIDGNVERVMARHQKIEATFPKAKKETKQMLGEHLPPDLPGEFAQAMMDLGATICTPKKPDCVNCPLNDDCQAYEYEAQLLYPKKQPKPEKPTRKGAAFVMSNGRDEVFLCKRETSGLLGGMTQVPTTSWTSNQDGETGIDAAPIQAEWKNRGIVKHTFTHFHLELTIWRAKDVTALPNSGWWCKIDAVEGEALPSVMQKVIKQALSM